MSIQINPEQWITAVLRTWRTTGHRITEPRMRVLRHIVSYTTPFSAETLHTDLQRDESAPGRATVYRTLEQLLGAGWVVRIHSGVGETGYYASWPGHVHYLVCTSCGKAIPFEGCNLGNLLGSLTQQTDFAVQGHLLEIYGQCADCQRTSAQEN